MTSTLTLRHDDQEAALPHQVEPPAEWGMILPDPVPFQVDLPRWCPVDSDALVALHWWASLSAHIHVLLVCVDNEQKVSYRVDKALRSTLGVVRDIYGGSASAAISVAGMNARGNVKDPRTEERELGAWTMAIQVAFGLLCVRAAAKGKSDPLVAEINSIYEWLSTAFVERLGDPIAFRRIMQLCTGTQDGTVDEKLAQWRGALEVAAEGAPDGLPALEGALDIAALEEPSAGDTLVCEGHGLMAVSEDGESRRSVNNSAGMPTHFTLGSGLAPGSNQTGVGESTVSGDKL